MVKYMQKGSKRVNRNKSRMTKDQVNCNFRFKITKVRHSF